MRAELVAIMRKEFRQTFRDRRMAFILIVAPIMQLVLLGYAVDLEVDHIPTAIHDLDRSPTARALLDGLLADGTLQHTQNIFGTNPAQAIESGVAQVVIEIPQGLEGDLKRGRSTEVQVLINGTDPIRAQVAMNTTLQYFQQQSQELALSRLRQSAAQQNQQATWPMLKMEPRILYNPQLKSSVYMVPGVAALTLLVVTTIVTAMGIAREREMGTIEQILITPLRPIVLLLGKIFPFALIGLVVAGLVLSVGTQLFSVPIRGSLLAIFLGTLLYLMSTLGTGVFISTIARTQQQAIMGGFFFLLPAILLSGFMSPVENMPAWIQPLTWINPVRYYVQILRASLLKGAKVTDLWLPLSALLGFGVGILSLAALRFRKQLA